MKKLLCTILVAVLLYTLAGCTEEISRTPIDSRFTASYSEVVTKYRNKLNPLTGKFQYVPDLYTVAHPDEYELLWEIHYDNGGVSEHWIQCTKQEYEEFNSKED